MSSKFKKINLLPILVIFIILFFIGLYISPLYFNKEYERIDQVNDANSLLKSVNEKEINSDDILISMLNGSNSYWAGWNWEDKMFYANIVGFDGTQDKLILQVLLPNNKEFSGGAIAVDVMCETNEVLTVDPLYNYKLVGPINDVSFEDLYIDGDEFYANCLDLECSKIGKRCVLKRSIF